VRSDSHFPQDPAERAPFQPSPAAVQRFLATTSRYGYWVASPDENAKIGLNLPEMTVPIEVGAVSMGSPSRRQAGR
jgi:hypothetical protein